jgi:two-component system, OmpR family, sensor histidine kinase BaeS
VPLVGRLAIRTQLAVALTVTAILAVAIATLLSNLGLPGRVTEAAEARLGRQAHHLAAVAAVYYREDGDWTGRHIAVLEHLAATSDVEVQIVSGGRALTLPQPRSQPTSEASAAIVVGGERIGTMIVRPAAGLFTAEEEHLRHSLDRLHLAAAGVSVLAALLLAAVFAQGLTGPLRRIRRSAEQISAGDLEARVGPGGGPELNAVATALDRLADTLAREEELRKESVADLAHELRTPVNGLLGRIEAAQDGVLEPTANLAAMHAEALRLTRLLDDLSRLSDAQRPGLLLEKEHVQLHELALAAVDRWRSRAGAAGIALEADASPALVHGDAGRLAQVLDNLIGNGVAHSGRDTQVLVRTATHGNRVLLEVSDTGVGIAPDDVPHVFGRFWRAERSRSPQTGGVGIGLTIARELVHAHDGVIEVESAPGEQTTFRVILPAGAAVGRGGDVHNSSTPAWHALAGKKT